MDGGALPEIPVSVRRGTASKHRGASAEVRCASDRPPFSPLGLAFGLTDGRDSAGQLLAGGMHSQKIPDKEPKSAASVTSSVCLRFNSGAYGQPGPRCRASHAAPAPKSQPRPLQPKPHGTLRPTPPFSVASIKMPRMPWDPPSLAAQDRDVLPRTRAKVPAVPHKGGLVPAFFAPEPRWCGSLLGPALPKPHPMLRPPPRSLRFCPPASPANRQPRVPTSFSVQDLPSTKARQEKRPRLGHTPRASAPSHPGPLLRE